MRRFRPITIPLSVLYGAVLYVRNVLYNNGMLKSKTPPVKTIAVGNLSLGGTGKTPQTEYLIELLHPRKTAVVSRGYGRITRGIKVVNPHQSTALEVGDEPLQIARKFPETPVVCDANRRRAIDFVQDKYPDTEVVILDDALQHRKVSAGLNVLLTTWDMPFTKDRILPWGRLRDHPVRAKQADVFVVTKTPRTANENRRQEMISSLDKYGKPVFFSTIKYSELLPTGKNTDPAPNSGSLVAVVTGIAVPDPFLQAVAERFEVARHFRFRDHHSFTKPDLSSIRDFIGNFARPIRGIITTEKDAMRLNDAEGVTQLQVPIFQWSIRSDFGNQTAAFDQLIRNYVDKP